jgi:lipopolysaccharide/colanic/teichoic acid biosynthesis glycosyltransferase
MPLPLPSTWALLGKTMVEWLLALVLLIAAAPFILLAVLAVKLTSRGPAFYSQTRLGRHGRPYTIYKIRTMVHNAEQTTGPRWATPQDPRITSVGGFLRQTHLDELPQLWNVIRGEMSLVGPRPERPEFVTHLEKMIPHYRDRLLVQPGVTGLAQICLPPDTDLDSVCRKLAHDLYYVRHMSPWLDLRLILLTACKMFAVPHGLERRLFPLPDARAVEVVYQGLLADDARLSLVHSAGPASVNR